MHVEIFLSVIVGELFAWFYASEREDINTPFPYINLTIRRARVVYESCDIGGNIAINHAGTTRPEKIFTSIILLLFFCGRTTGVFNNARSLWNVLFCKEATTTI